MPARVGGLRPDQPLTKLATAMIPELFHIPYSPWSEKARWALERRGIHYRGREYVPMLSEPILRVRLKKPTGRVTVPVLLTADGAHTDSLDIARWADRHGSGPALFPAGRPDEVERWNERSEIVMASGRALTTQRVALDREARRESVPRLIGSVGPLAQAMAGMGVRYLTKKYGLDADQQAAHRARMAEQLLALREALSAGSGTISGELSYADIAMAAALGFVRPVEGRYLSLGSASRRAWTDDELAREFDDLLKWRDHIYREHRR